VTDHPIDSAVPLPSDVAAGAAPIGAIDSSAQPAVVQGRFVGDAEGYFALAWRRFRRSAIGMLGLILVALLIVVSIFADFFAPMDPNAASLAFASPDSISFQNSTGQFSLTPNVFPIVESDKLDPVTYQPLTAPDYTNPTPLGFFAPGYSYKFLWFVPASVHFFGATNGKPVHFLGTDRLGRDILSRGIIGSRISLTIALAVVTLTTILGTLVGLTSGYLGGRVDAWVQRFVDFVLAFPQLPLYLALTTLIPVTAPSNLFIAFVIGVMAALGWAQLSREVRSKTMALARIEYVRAAIAVGSSDFRVISRHILPNVLSHIIVAVTLAIPSVVLLESFLGFLGFAVKPPLISWGLMLQDCATFSVIGSYPWILSPVGFVLIAVFAFNALGDGLRDAVDPY
jgi:peptide/nickel transport system permease protein